MPIAVMLTILLGLFAATPRPSPTPSPSPTAEPLDVRVRVDNNDHGPIHIFKASLRNAANFRYEQCVSFRNVSTKVATDVDLSFVITNRRGETEADFGRLDKGTFTPPIAIDNHCWYAALWPKRTVKRMTDEIVRVKSVAFADGTRWEPGAAFTRGYAKDGQPLQRPVLEGGGATGGGLPPATSTRPLAGAARHGAIYYEPGSFASGSAVDRPSSQAARADARSACNAQTGGRNDCVLGTDFSTSRCGAIGVANGQVEYGVGDNERDARAMVLGKVAGVRVITVECNAGA